MSDTSTDPSNPPQAADSQVNILAQYVRDLSFENPMAPETLRATRSKPNLDINIGVDARKIPDDTVENLYESIISLRATAKDDDGNPTFILEMLYGMAVVLKDLPVDSHHAVMLVEIPRLGFPFVRQIVSDITQNAGFPPLMLNPVDFHQLYVERYKDEIEAAQKQAQESDKKAKSAKKADAKD